VAAKLTVEMSRDTKEAIAAAGATFVSWATFGIGLVAPLTPSEGLPSLSVILLFYVFPLALFVIVATMAVESIVRWFAGLQLLLMVAAGIWLARIML
jgi:hypothetical protein